MLWCSLNVGTARGEALFLTGQTGNDPVQELDYRGAIVVGCIENTTQRGVTVRGNTGNGDKDSIGSQGG